MLGQDDPPPLADRAYKKTLGLPRVNLGQKYFIKNRALSSTPLTFSDLKLDAKFHQNLCSGF